MVDGFVASPGGGISFGGMGMRDPWKLPLAELTARAGEANRRAHGGEVTYVVNRNANFTRVCQVGCSFCGFGRRPGTLGATSDTIDQVVARVGQTPWVTEVCLQGGMRHYRRHTTST